MSATNPCHLSWVTTTLPCGLCVTNTQQLTWWTIWMSVCVALDPGMYLFRLSVICPELPEVQFLLASFLGDPPGHSCLSRCRPPAAPTSEARDDGPPC